MKFLPLFFFVALAIAIFPDYAFAQQVPAPNIESFTIATTSPENRQVPFYLRIPSRYNPKQKGKAHRLLYVCPVYNADATKVVSGEGSYKEIVALADKEGWFLLSGTFKPKFQREKERFPFVSI